MSFKIAKAIVYNNVKKALGLDNCQYFFFGAAPLDPNIRSYFLSLNINLINSYGMSESTGPQNFTDQTSLDYLGPPEAFREVGRNLPGTQIIIVKANEADDDGTYCSIQVRSATEAETSSWDTTRIHRKQPRQSTATDICTLETTER